MVLDTIQMATPLLASSPDKPQDPTQDYDHPDAKHGSVWGDEENDADQQTWGVQKFTWGD